MVASLLSLSNIRQVRLGYVVPVIIIIMMSCRYHGYPWLFLATSPDRSSPPAGLQSYIPYLHIAAVCMFELVVLLFARDPLEYITYKLVPACLVRLTINQLVVLLTELFSLHPYSLNRRVRSVQYILAFFFSPSFPFFILIDSSATLRFFLLFPLFSPKHLFLQYIYIYIYTCNFSPFLFFFFLFFSFLHTYIYIYIYTHTYTHVYI